jgi:DNA-binding transcriptional regulator YiaG
MKMLDPVKARDLVRIRRMAALGTARAIREAAGLSLTELANEIDVHRTTIHRWEQGARRPSGAGALRYLRALDELSGR